MNYKAFRRAAVNTAGLLLISMACIASACKDEEQIDRRDSFISVGGITRGDSSYRKNQLYMLFGMAKSSINFFEFNVMYGDESINVNPHWVRDHILILKSARYLRGDVASFINLLLEEQHPDGFFYEIIAPYPGDPHAGYMVSPEARKLEKNADGENAYLVTGKPRFAKIDENKGFGLCRLELEADVEYLMVEGAYLAWQATGDMDFLKRSLPKLEKGLNYIMTDPTRWDKTYNLAKRPRTIDTWDFLNNKRSSMDRTIHPDDPMGIMHGDNTGLYQAEILLAKMYRAAGDISKASHWEKLASELKERINKHLWNGEFYKHYIPLTPVNYGVDDATQLSLSNAYNINRGVTTPEMTRKVINRYRSMRDKYKGDFDDFRTLDPAYPEFNGYKAGKYLNGTIGPFVAGQLAVAAYENGMEDYGSDILERFASKIKADGKVAFLYGLDGNDIGGGPRSWSGAELLYAFTRGLAGVKDNAALFEDVTISPRWVSANKPSAHVFLKYPASGRFVEYKFFNDTKNKRLKMNLISGHKNALIRILLPKGAKNPNLTIDGKPQKTDIEDVFGSKYVLVKNPAKGSIIEISYK